MRDHFGRSAQRKVSKQSASQNLADIIERPSKEAENTFREMLHWLHQGLPPASNGAFLSSRCSW